VVEAVLGRPRRLGAVERAGPVARVQVRAVDVEVGGGARGDGARRDGLAIAATDVEAAAAEVVSLGRAGVVGEDLPGERRGGGGREAGATAARRAEIGGELEREQGGRGGGPGRRRGRGAERDEARRAGRGDRRR